MPPRCQSAAVFMNEGYAMMHADFDIVGLALFKTEPA